MRFEGAITQLLQIPRCARNDKLYFFLPRLAPLRDANLGHSRVLRTHRQVHPWRSMLSSVRISTAGDSMARSP